MKSNSFMRNRKAFTTVLLFCTGFIASHPLVVSCLLYTSPSPRDGLLSRMPSSA